VEDDLYPQIVKALQQYANAAVSTLTQEESDDEEVQEESDPISRQSPYSPLVMLADLSAIPTQIV
jgi:hypothetical protein